MSAEPWLGRWSMLTEGQWGGRCLGRLLCSGSWSSAETGGLREEKFALKHGIISIQPRLGRREAA